MILPNVEHVFDARTVERPVLEELRYAALHGVVRLDRLLGILQAVVAAVDKQLQLIIWNS